MIDSKSKLTQKELLEIRSALIMSCKWTEKEIKESALKFINRDVMIFNAILRLGYIEKQDKKLYKVLIKHGVEIGEGDVIDKLDKLLIKLRRKK